MTARDAGGIASRVLAIYCAVQILPFFLFILDDLRISSSTNFFHYLLRPLIQMFGLAGASILLWVKSSSLWPSDVAVEGNPAMDRTAWSKVAVMMLGLYFLIFDGPSALYLFIRATLQSTLPDFNMDDHARYLVCARAVLGILFVGWAAIGWNKGAPVGESAN